MSLRYKVWNKKDYHKKTKVGHFYWISESELEGG